jgi:hypothetical protein
LLGDKDAALLVAESTAEQPQSAEEMLPVLRERLPAAEHRYLEAFAREPFLSMFGPAQGAVVNHGLQALEQDEQENWALHGGKACWALFNPAGRPPNDGADRWLYPSKIEELAEQLRTLGHDVHVLDAAARRLDEREAFEWLLGLEPAVVILSAAEGKLDRLAASARRLRLVERASFRLVLLWTGAMVPPVRAEELPMFDAIHERSPYDGTQR